MNIVEIGGEFRAFRAHCGEKRPVMLEERFLQVPVPQRPPARSRVSKSVETSGGATSFSNRIAMFCSASGLGSCGERLSMTRPMTFFRSTFSSPEDLIVLPVRFTIFLAIDAGNHRHFREDLGLGNNERLAIQIVELDGDVAGDFHVLASGRVPQERYWNQKPECLRPSAIGYANNPWFTWSTSSSARRAFLSL